MRTYEQIRDAIIEAIPLQKEMDSMTDEQIQNLRKYGNALDNTLYMQTREWKEWRAANPPTSVR